MFIVGFVASQNQNNLFFWTILVAFFPLKHLGNFLFSLVNETNSGYFWKIPQDYFRSQNWPINNK
jgi:hypothetical protein